MQRGSIIKHHTAVAAELLQDGVLVYVLKLSKWSMFLRPDIILEPPCRHVHLKSNLRDFPCNVFSRSHRTDHQDFLPCKSRVLTVGMAVNLLSWEFLPAFHFRYVRLGVMAIADHQRIVRMRLFFPCHLVYRFHFPSRSLCGWFVPLAFPSIQDGPASFHFGVELQVPFQIEGFGVPFQVRLHGFVSAVPACVVVDFFGQLGVEWKLPESHHFSWQVGSQGLVHGASSCAVCPRPTNLVVSLQQRRFVSCHSQRTCHGQTSCTCTHHRHFHAVVASSSCVYVGLRRGNEEWYETPTNTATSTWTGVDLGCGKRMVRSFGKLHR
mmetsp:Transcript_7795/g.48334  ORF Transcript_7795/g.48334 Transcript_7795/m.48334 type:complete len:323 (+) Transcript_7795:2802-3770(+)